MKITWRTLLALCLPVHLAAQELFPRSEPASTVPAHVLGVRLFSETYNEVNRVRNLFGIKLMYGLTPRLTIGAIPTCSNHHSKELPPEFPTHNTPQIGVTLPYRFNGVDFYARYRLVSKDGANRHFRAAVYGEYSLLQVAHDEAEPSLLDDNSGFGSGLILTYLQQHFAVSLTSGIIVPFQYTGSVPDPLPGLPGVPATITYPVAYNATLSFGYLLFPEHYRDYRQTNWSFYLEFSGKQYGAMKMQVGNIYSSSQPQYYLGTAGNRALQAGRYIDAFPGIQAIIRSDVRMEFSVGFPLVSRSFVHFYPMYCVGGQRYLYHHSRQLKSREYP